MREAERGLRSALRNYRRGCGSRRSRTAWRLVPTDIYLVVADGLWDPAAAASRCGMPPRGSRNHQPATWLQFSISTALARNHSALRLRFARATALQSSRTVNGSFFHSDAASTNASAVDPILGIMRYDWDGAPAFVFDMMEPERPKVDRAVLPFLKSEALHPADFTIREDGVVRLNPELARRVVAITGCSEQHGMRAPVPLLPEVGL